MTDHNPHNRDVDLDEPGPAGASLRTLVCDWFRANGINPAHVPSEARASLVDGQVTLLMKVRGPNGHDVIDPSGFELLKETKTFPVAVPPPPLVAEWLAPKCPTCGR
jgi:hypothetical protein